MARVTNIISAGDNSTIESAKEYFRQLEEGRLGVIQENPFLNDDDLKVQGGSEQAHKQLTDLIELEQYLKASLFNILGLQANYNMKRESLNSNEAQLNDDATKPFIEGMLKCRQEAAERINRRFGTEISVELAGVWKEKEEEDEQITSAGIDEGTAPEEPESVPEVEEGNDGSSDEGESVPEVSESEGSSEESQGDEEPESSEPDVKIEINIENAEEVKTEGAEEDGDPDESENKDSVPDSGDPDEPKEQEDGGMADSDDDGKRNDA